MTHHRPAGRAPALLAAVLAAGLLALAAGAAGPAPAAAQTGRPTVALLSQSPWVGPEGELVLRLAVEGVEEVEDAELAVFVYPRLTSRSAFEQTLLDRHPARPLDITSAPLDELGRDPAGAVVVRVPLTSGAPDPDRLLLRREGVYPVAVELRERGGGPAVAGFTTHLVRVPDGEVTPLAVAWVQPVRAESGLRPDGSVALGPATRTHLEDVVGVLAASPELPLSIAPGPETVDTLARDGPATRAVLASLAGAIGARQVVPGPYVPVDVPQLLAARLDDELRAQVARGSTVLAEHLAVRPDARTWLVDGAIDSATVSALRELGVDRLVVPEDVLSPVDLPVTLTRPFRIEGPGRRLQHAAVADAGLSRHFAHRDGDEVLAAHHLLADLAVLYFDNPGLERGVVVVPPREARSGLLDVALRALDRSTILAPVTLDDFFAVVPEATDGGEPLTRRLVPRDPRPLGVAPDELRDVREALTGFAAMTEAAGERFVDLERHLLAAQRSGLNPAARRAHLAAAVRQLEEELDLVQLPDGQGITLTARDGVIPLAFLNRTDYTVRVVVRLDSDRLEFRDGKVRVVDLRPGTTTVQFAVRARTPGAFGLLVQASSPDDRLLVDETRFTVRSTAASGVGVVLSVAAGLFLAVWWARHWRTTRRDRRLVVR